MTTHEQSQNNDENTNVEKFTLTTEEAVERFASAGVPRSLPTINRFCKHGNLSCRKLPVNQTLKYFVSEQSLERVIKELQQMTTLQKESEYKIDEETATLLKTNHDYSQETMSNHEQSVDEDEDITALTVPEGVEVAEERGSLRAENARLREDIAKAREEKARTEGELAVYRMTGEKLPQILEQVTKLAADNGKLIGDAQVFNETIKRLQDDKKELGEKIRMLEAPKEEPKRKGLFGFLKG